ncbi:MAG TPA: PGPGW domain-containing protein [Actinomycetota bacterium]|nr:PGPGW domain-containing protein [Actinomycetota bacterium]
MSDQADQTTDPTKGLNPLTQIIRFIGRSGKRIAVTIVGFAVLIAGVVMMVTPGPGVLVIVLGLAILASEWAWAERALDRAKAGGKVVLEQATASPIRIALSVLLTLGGIAAVLVYFLVIR